MKLVIDIPEPLLKKVRGEIESGEYETPQEFVRVALENQLEIGSRPENREDFPSLNEFMSDEINSGGLDTQQILMEKFSIPDRRKVSVCEEPEDNQLTSGPLWGQYNRIFPIKVVVRILASELSESNDKGVPFEDFQNQVSSHAREIGLEIRDIDNKKSRPRGEKLSAGLPVGDDAEKSADRFLSHFVGRRDGNGNLNGAPAQLGLINIFGSSPEKIGLTESGLEFAILKNPLLDESLEASNPLSEAEKQFYIEHASKARLGEFDAILSVANQIVDGTDRPKELTREIAKLNSNWSQAQANTMRTGLLSRMFELGLVTRHRVGQRGIAYELTAEGMEVIKNE